MDEMEMYREGITRRENNRRRKGDRRRARRNDRPFFDWMFLVEILVLIGMGIALYYAN